MPLSPRLNQTAMHCLGLILAVCLLTPAAALNYAAAQYIGPQPPQPKQMQQTPVTKAIGKLFKKKGEADEEAGDDADAKADDAGATGPQAGGSKPRVMAPGSQMAGPPHDMPQRPPMLTQPPLENAKVDEPQVDADNPPVMDHPKLDDPTNPLGLTDAENRLKRLITLLDAQRFGEARPPLTQLRQYLVDITEAHIGLYKTLNQVPSARGQAELEKTLALQFAQLRDRAMVEMSRIYISEHDYSHAVKELTEVVKSQPRSKLGLHSYEMLQEIGFTEKLQLAQ